MPKVPTGSDNLTFKPGIYLVEVGKATEGVSKLSNTPMITVRLVAVEYGGQELLCYDRIMLAGGGAGIGRAKLVAMGYKPGESFETAALTGKRLYVAVIKEEYGGEMRLKVDVGAPTSHGGYWSEKESAKAIATRKPEPEPDEEGGVEDGSIPF